MTKKSRLRTKGNRRRRLFTIVLLILAGAGVIMWLTTANRPHLVEQFLDEWGDGIWDSGSESQLVRGTIYDRNYKELAVSYERVSVYANIPEISNLAEIVSPLSTILDESEKVLYERLSGNTLRLWLAKDISQDQEEKIRNLDLSGVFFHKEHVRYHPQTVSGAHLMGFVENNSGLAGVEYLLDQLQNRYRLNNDKSLELEQVADVRPGADGQHLVLTLDMKIQKTIDRFLGKYSKNLKGSRFGVMVMEAGSGDLIGYSQTPSFDPNRFHTFPKNIFRDLFDTPVALPESFKTYFRELSLLESQVGEKTTSLPWSVLAEKRKLGVQLQLWDTLGAGPGEKYDFINSQLMSSANDLFTNAASMGRDFETVPAMLTPLQIMTAIGRSVNGGNSILPHAGGRYILRKSQGEYLLEDLKTPIKGNILHEGISTEAKYLFESLGQESVLKSTTLFGESSSYHQKKKNELRNHRLALTLVPVRDPELIIMMVVEEPGYMTRNKEELNSLFEIDELIVPVSALQQVMKNLADMVKPKAREEKNFQNRNGADKGTKSGFEESWSEHKLIITRMPDLRGMSLRKSIRLLQDTGVEIKVIGSGRIISHEPVAGSVLVGGAKVILTLERDITESSKLQNSDNDH